MNFRSALKDASARSRGIVDRVEQRAGFSSNGGSLSQGFGGSFGRTAPGFTHAQEQLSHFRGYSYSVIRLISSRIAGQPVRFARELGEIEHNSGMRWGKSFSSHYIQHKVPSYLAQKSENAHILDDHRIMRVLDNPNPIMVRFNFFYVTLCSLEITGRGFWWMRRAEDNESGMDEIWPIPTPWMTPIHKPSLFHGWRMRPPGFGESFELPASCVVYFNYPDPGDMLGAMSPMQALSKTVLADESIETAQYRAFMNGTNPGLAITVGKLMDPSDTGLGSDEAPVLTKAQRMGIINQFKAHYAGVMRHDEPLIIDGYIKDVKRISQNNREMDFLNSGMSTKNRLSQGWNVNPTSLGERDISGRNAAAVADDHLCMNVINPRLEMMSQVMSGKVAGFFSPEEDVFGYFELASSKDAEFNLAVNLAMMDRGAMSRNELRSEYGKPRIADGDNSIMASAVVPILPEEPPVPVIDPPSVSRSKKIGVVPEAEAITRKHSPACWKAAGFDCHASGLHVEQLADINMEFRDRAREQFGIDLRDFFLELGKQLRGTLAANFRAGHAAPYAHEGMLFEDKEIRTALINFCAPRLEVIALRSANLEYELYRPRKDLQRMDFKGLDDWINLPKRIFNSIRAGLAKLMSFDFWGKIITTIRNDVHTSLVASGQAGKDAAQAADDVAQNVFGPTASAVRGANIAGPEADAAANIGQDIVGHDLAKFGVVRRRQWITRHDLQVRTTHRAANAQIRIIGEPFDVGGEKAMYPKDPRLSAKERCNCRCIAVTLLN